MVSWRFATVALAVALATGAAAQDAGMRRYRSAFGEVQDRVRADEAARARAVAVDDPGVWDEGEPAPRGLRREAPEAGAAARLVVGRASAGSSLDAGDDCRAAPGTRVMVLGTAAPMGVLVSVEAVPPRAREGDCPVGARVFVPEGRFRRWEQAGAWAARRGARVAAASEAARRVLGDEGEATGRGAPSEGATP